MHALNILLKISYLILKLLLMVFITRAVILKLELTVESLLRHRMLRIHPELLI